MLACSCLARASGLRAGIAKIEITPKPGEQMWGYESRTTPATGTLDPLYARVVILDANAKRLGLVALDLGRAFGPASLDQLRAAAARHGISCLLVAASHTHSGPVVQDEYRQGTPAWERAALNGIENALQRAVSSLVDARIGTGYGTAYIGHNRLRVNPDGTVSWFEVNQTQIPTAPFDPTVSILRIDRTDGHPMAVLVNYACHPVVFGPDNVQYSADYPGVMTRVVESALGGDALAVFLQGAPGDINPYYAVTPLKQDAVGRRDWTGQKLGDEAIRVTRSIKAEPEPHASIDFVEEKLPMHIRWDLEGFRLGLKRFLGDAYDQYASRITPNLDLPVSTVLINRRIALMAVPGEPFVDFQISWRQRCAVADAFFLGYTNGYFGYFPTIRMASLGGYGAASASTWLEVGAGERMVDRAVVHVYEMLGRLHSEPDEMRNKSSQ
ncbi:MAG: neutral/alkaline non-lysosomal ceramidase N-terminal domain-containing protein [Acidobacteriaceae bacterium]|nr:neutral/alkaline non-lysosomal ceramidase N-terminal domain-containing protein [Acidobacteriaceae bacterium]MBV9499863.1 neutral/alkaline non-lysosomal ceramidase N-terminal domain-containing protein [Acidobacteriaceae bacterium]